MDITQALLATQQQDANLRNQAEQFLFNLQTQNLTLFLLTLVNELANEQKPSLSRQAAGLKLKNIFESRVKETKQALAAQWRQIAPEVKNQIRNQVLTILHSPVKEARRTAAQILSTISIIELNASQWIDVIDMLCMNVTQPKTEFGVEASLVAIGYICEDCVAPILQTRSDRILTAVIQGFRVEQKNQDVRLAAGTALSNILNFIKGNFQKDHERGFIMKTIFDATTAPSEHLRLVAMECLVNIAHLYYDKLKDHMQLIYEITVKAAKTDSYEKVAQQALEFWSTVADMEYDIQQDLEFAQKHNQTPTRISFNFVRAALKPLVQLLTELLAAQPDEQFDDEEETSRASTAGTTLSLVAKVAGDDIVVATMPFISQHINSQNWKYREAATLAFSAILDGPTSRDKMKTLVNQAVPVMLSHISDKEVIVRDTTVFTIGRIAEFHFDALADGNHLDNVMKALAISLKDEPRVASRAAWSLSHVCEALDVSDNPDATTSALSPYFVGLVRELLVASQRTDADENNLRLNVYGALTSAISAAAPDQHQHMEGIAGVILQKLADTLKQSGLTSQDKEEIYALQGLLCYSLNTLTAKMGEAVKKFSDQLMNVYLSIFQYRNAISEESMSAIAALATAIGRDFEKYMTAFKPFLLAALKNKNDVHVCTVAINAFGDLCYALGSGISSICDEVVTLYLTHLQDQQVSRSIKPLIISSFGDIALAIGGQFEKYIKFVAAILKKASEVQAESSTEEMLEYINLLREHILEAYTGILQGLKTEKPLAFNPFVDDLVNFIRTISQDDSVDEIVFNKAVQMIGDLANIYQQKIKPMLEQQFVKTMVDEAMKSDDPKTKECAKYANKQLKKMSAL